MSNELSFTVLCEDCDDRKEDLQLRGYEVLGPCGEDQAQPGMCVIRYRLPRRGRRQSARWPRATPPQRPRPPGRRLTSPSRRKP